jgi:hypothetical protein
MKVNTVISEIHTTRIFGIKVKSVTVKKKSKTWQKSICYTSPGFSTTEINFNHKTNGGNKMTTILKDGEAKGKSALVVFGNPINRAGNPAPVQAGTVKFASTNEEVLTVEPSPEDGDFAVKATFTGKLGSADVTITADADLEDDGNIDTQEDETIISGLSTFVIEPEMASGFGAETIGELV